MKLKEIKGEEAVEKLGLLMEASALVTMNPVFLELKEKAKEARDKGDDLEKRKISAKMVRALLQEEPKAIKDMIAIVNGEDPETYEGTFAEIASGVNELFTDPNLRSLFL